MNQEIRYLGKIVGTIKGQTFITRRRPEHFFIKFRGFGLSTGLIKQLKERYITTVIIIYTQKNGVEIPYTCALRDFYEYGEHWTDKEADTQLIMPLAKMQAL